MTAAVTNDEVTSRLSRELGTKAADIPVMPRVAREALKLAQSPALEPDEVVRLAESDAALAGRLLAVSNSALYARGVALTSVQRAVVRLGMQATRDVLFQAVYATMLPDVPGFRERMAAIFRHGVLVSRLARQLAPRMALDADVAFLAGLMHDVGRARCLKVVSKWLRGGVSSGLPSEALDRAVDILHAPAGADLVRAWHLGADVAVACEFHHAPAGRPLAALVALADLLAHGAENRDDDSGVMRIDAADTDAGCDPLARALDACQLPQSARDELVAIAAEEARFVTE